MNRLTSLGIAFIVGLTTGCTRYTYRLDLKPESDGLVRTFDWSVHSGRHPGLLPQEELTRIAGLYGAEAAVDPTRSARFAAPFQGAMPDDVGGFGRTMVFPSSFGALHVYAERFRADDDALGRWERQAAAIDTTVDLWTMFLRETLSGEDGLDKLEAAMNTRLRRDWKSAALIITGEIPSLLAPHPLAVSAGEEEEALRHRAGALAGRLALFLMEREYVGAEDIPLLLRAMYGDDADRDREGGVLFSRALLRWMGRTADHAPRAFKTELAGLEGWSKRFELFLAGSQDAARLLSNWAAAARINADEPKSPGVLATSALLAAVFPGFEGFLNTSDELEVSLALGDRPLVMNGRWSEATRLVEWKARLPVEGAAEWGAPTIAVAAWVTPDQDSQTRRFGRTVLDGEPLAQFCLWQAGLDGAHRARWQKFLDTLTPGPGLADTLESFRFDGDPPRDQAPAGADLIARQLRAAPPK